MFCRQSETQVADRHENDDHGRGRNLSPGSSKNKNRQPQNRKDETGFLAEGAEKEQCSRGDEKQPPVRPGLRRGANGTVKSEESEHGRERIGPAGNVSDGCAVDGMDRPEKRSQEREPAPFGFLDVPTAQEFIREKKERERGAGVAKDAREMVARRLEEERGVIHQISQPLDRPVEVGRCRVEEEKMLERLRRELPAPDKRIAQDQGGVVPNEIVSERGGVNRKDG